MNIEKQSSRMFRGVGIGNGCACGVLRFWESQVIQAPVLPEASRGEDAETLRLQQALRVTGEHLHHLREKTARELGDAEAEIFEIHAMLLEDEDFLDGLAHRLHTGCTAEDAVRQTASTFGETLRGIGDAYLSARAKDIEDIAAQLLHALSEKGTERSESVFDGMPNGTEPYILVARDLTPSQTMGLEREHLLGFVTMEGSSNSHTAILARAMGLPALVGVGDLDAAMQGCEALLDAREGTLTVCPTSAQKHAFCERQGRESELAREHERYLRSLINKPAITCGGHRMLIYANVSGAEEALSAYRNGADGIGLLRSELLYLSSERLPTEEELYQSYRDVVDRMGGKRVVIRTLDVGADKQLSYLALPKEENPALGFRGIRVSLEERAIFKTQLRALLRAGAHGSISIMLPMVIGVSEVQRSRAVLEECKQELLREGIGCDERIELGVMIETPAAAVMSAELAAEVDFFSVGTNDLLQYTLAADRQNPRVAALCEENEEPVLRLIGYAAESIHRHGGWIGICGEMAADLSLTQRFVDMKIDELSVSVPYLLGVREKVTECK